MGSGQRRSSTGSRRSSSASEKSAENKSADNDDSESSTGSTAKAIEKKANKQTVDSVLQPTEDDLTNKLNKLTFEETKGSDDKQDEIESEIDTSDLEALLDSTGDLPDSTFLPPPLQDPPAVPLPELPKEESFQAETQAPAPVPSPAPEADKAKGKGLTIDTARTKHDPGDLEIVGQAGENPSLAHLKKLVIEGVSTLFMGALSHKG
jgi:hypothetical protein